MIHSTISKINSIEQLSKEKGSSLSQIHADIAPDKGVEAYPEDSNKKSVEER